MKDILNSFWDTEKINENQWEETAQGLNEYIEKEDWTLINFEDFDAVESVAFLDGIVRLDGEIFHKETKARIRLFSLASGVCEMKNGVYNDFEAFKSIKTKKIAIPDKDLPKKYIIVRESRYEITSKDEDHLVLLKQLEYESLMDYKERSATRLIIWDGALPIVFSGIDGKIICGIIKSHRKYFVSPQNLELLYEIKPFQRTPIIHYSNQELKRFYYTWYTTLNEDITGLVRVETLADMDVKEASKLANNVCAILRRFASSPIYEQRAPQNLAPVSALESYLRSYLGHYFFDSPIFA